MNSLEQSAALTRRSPASGCYAAHVARLQEQNRLLAECLADERRLRKNAYAWYQKRLQSRWWSLMDMVLLSVRHNEKLCRPADSEAGAQRKESNDH